MIYGTLSKMKSTLSDTVDYQLPVGDALIPLNPLLGNRLSLNFTGNIYCSACGRKTKKSFSQGYCFPCMKSLARCDMCIMRPETCHFDQGTCREPDWAQENCMISHYVYLANTSGLKVGITRYSQIPTRWVDQGASQALPIFSVATRKVSGQVEIALANYMADKTNWRAILKGESEPLDLERLARESIPRIGQQLNAIRSEMGEEAVKPLDCQIQEIRYPVLEYPDKIVSHNFDKQAQLEGELMGIKGQYLIFDSGVINIRKFTAYEVEMEF